MKGQKKALVVLQGGALTFIKRWVRPKKRGKRKKQSKALKLYLRRKRTIKSLIRTFNSFKCNNQWFISLIIPKQLGISDDNNAKTKLLLYEKFVDKLLYRCKKEHMKCRFIKKIEWKPKAGIHFHLIGSFSKKLSLEAVNELIRDLWAKTICITDKLLIRKAAKTVKFKECHYTYLTKESKRRNDMHCLEIIGSCNMYGFINKKHFKFYGKIYLELYEWQLDQFFFLILEYLKDNDRSKHSYVRQMERTVGMLSFIPHKKIIEFYNDVTAN